jgi:hypothetical protein
MRFHPALLLSLIAITGLAACGDDGQEAPADLTGTTGGGGGASGGDGTESIKVPAASPEETAAAPPAAPPSATPPAAPAPDMRLQPFEVGRTWSYRIRGIGGHSYSACPDGDRTISVLAKDTKMGRANVFTVRFFCPQPDRDVWQSETGPRDAVDWHLNGQWMRATDEPSTAGHSWMIPGAQMTYEDVPSITVPAGTFTSCLRVTRSTRDVTQTYCRGVGLVREELQTTVRIGFVSRTLGYVGELVSKNF